MTSTAPWWGSSLFALATGMLTALTAAFATILPKRTDRKTEQRRLSRELKERLYPEVTRCAFAIVTAPLWETARTTRQIRLDELTAITQQATFFTSENVGSAIGDVIRAANDLTDIANNIEASSKPGHQGAIDRRFAAEYATALDELRSATARFARAGREDLEIRGTYRPPTS